MRMNTVTTATADLARYQTRLRFPPDLEEAYRDDFYQKSLRFGRPILIMGILVYALFGILDVWLLPLSYRQAWLIRGIVAVCLLGALLFSFTRHYRAHIALVTSVSLFAVNAGLIAIIALARPTETNAVSYVAGLMITVVLAYVQANLFWYATATNWLIFGLYLVVVFGTLGGEQDPQRTQTYVALTFFLFTMMVVGTGVGYFVELANRRDFLQQRLIDHQRREAEDLRAESERLLLNILPEPIAERLKHGELIADYFEAATVMFSDMVNFTPLSSTLPPRQIVELLNKAFSTFDQLAEKYGLEKIKTIGDSYMVVGGVPVPRPDHAEALADMALEMQAMMERLRRDGLGNVQLRIGMNSGPVVAGVIGLKKFIYDLWGDTVNSASRMESHGVADRVQCTAATYELLKDRYDFEDRGVIHVKGKGDMHVYLLVGKKA